MIMVSGASRRSMKILDSGGKDLEVALEPLPILHVELEILTDGSEEGIGSRYDRPRGPRSMWC